MCGSAEGPTPEQLAHRPETAFERCIRLEMQSLERDSLESNTRILRALMGGHRHKGHVSPDGRYIVWPIKKQNVTGR